MLAVGTGVPSHTNQLRFDPADPIRASVQVLQQRQLVVKYNLKRMNE